MGKCVWRAYSPFDAGESYSSKDMHEEVLHAIDEAKTRVYERLGESPPPAKAGIEFELVF